MTPHADLVQRDGKGQSNGAVGRSDVPHRTRTRHSQHAAEGLTKKWNEGVEVQIVIRDESAVVAVAAGDVLGTGKIARIWRIAEDHPGLLAVHEAIHLRTIGRIAGHYSVGASVAAGLPQEPNFGRAGNQSFRNIGNIVLVSQPRCCFFGRQKPGQFLVVEPDQAQIELCFLEGLQLDAKAFFVPTSVKCELVVSDNQGTALGFCEMAEHDHRNFLHAELAGCQ